VGAGPRIFSGTNLVRTFVKIITNQLGKIMQKSVFMLLILGFSITSALGQKSYENEWKEVESLVRKGLPQSALQIVDSIYRQAKDENNPPQFLKAALYQVRLKSDYQEDFMESSIALVSQEIKTANAPALQILHSIQAELFWRYYQGNRYKFMDRTRVSNPDPEDIKTWDLETIVKEVTKNYLASINDAGELQKVKLDAFDPILESEEGSKTYRPTLYDFLAHRALEFFANEEPAIIRLAEGFSADLEVYFASAGNFTAFTLPDSGKEELKWRALDIYQDLLRFHLYDQDPAALIDVDLQRIKFAVQISALPNRHDLYLQALKSLYQSYPAHQHTAGVCYEIALEYARRGAEYIPHQSDTNRWALKMAKETCDKTIVEFAGSEGASNCAILLRQLTEPALGFTVNYANLPEQPFLGSMIYKNLNKVYFRIIKFNAEDDRDLRQKERGEKIIAKYLTMAPVTEWSEELPDEGDLQSHNTQVRLPGLAKGYYIILVSDNPEFSVNEKSVAYASCWITAISYISSGSGTGEGMEVYVLDRDKGTALRGVTAQVYVREYNYQSRSYENKAVNAYTSDEEGYFKITSPENASKSFYLQFSRDDDQYFTENYFYISPPKQEDISRISAHFFTDRSIYRPGQTVYFKGIILERTGQKTVIKTDYTTVVTFYDANSQKIAELAMTTNEFGSFNGTFTAPTGGLTGEMSIRNESGQTSFSVEEYKRPRFKVGTDPLEGSYRLNEVVNVKGKALNYTGSAVDQALVAYRVVRTARFPYWRSWWDWFPAIPEVEIASGKTITDADGAFNVSFKAIPDAAVDQKLQPVFNYTVYIDVTDITGEVRSAEERLSVGYTSLLLDLDLPEKLDITGEKEFRLTAKNLNGQPLSVEGKISVYPLDAPDRLIRDRSWGRPDVFLMSREDFLKEFPFDLFDNENDPETWNRKALVQEKKFNSSGDTVFTFENLPEGDYVAVIEALDPYGEKVEVKKYFTAYNPGSKHLLSKNPFWHAILESTGEPGDTASLLVGTAEKNIRLLYEIENNGKVIHREWLPLNQEKTRLDIPVIEEYRGNFYVNLVFVRGNHSYDLSEKITVPFTDRQLKITTETFRDKLIPGQQEEWKLKITGMKGEQVAAELLASMYDASLDAFREHQWLLDLYPYRYKSGGWNTMNAFSQTSSHFVSEKTRMDDTPFIQNYDRLNWFGFNYYGTPYLRVGGMQMDMMKSAAAEMDGRQGDAAAEMPAKDSDQAVNGQEESVEEQKKPAEMPIRKNFNETAFFFPSLRTDENGSVILKFTVPESLTAWKLMALAYTKDLKTGQLEKEVVTRKELMVMTNPPRFFREGDRIFFSAKLVSLSEEKLQGQIVAEFFDAYTMQSIDDLLGNGLKTKTFSVEKGNSEVFNWDISIPEGIIAIVCRVRATSGSFADGEEIIVAVLPNRMLVTETLPLPISGKGAKNFKFSKLAESAKSGTIKSFRLTLEFTSNPAWYAVQALPYLAENPHESADGVFSRYYANTLASFIANSNPKIRQVFENWKNITPDALLSNLEKNQELKAVLLTETPWVLEAKDETERKKRIALLFDLNRLAGEQQSSLEKLRQMQSPNGGWPWFDGMPDNRYITQLIVTGFGKLHQLQVIDLKKNHMLRNTVQQAFQYLDKRIKEDYDYIVEHNKDKLDENHLGSTQIQYLYAYSYLKDFVQVDQASREAFDYFRNQAVKHWVGQNKYLQGMIALALYRLEIPGTPVDIISSLKENALYSEEMGMYWRAADGYYWHEAPVERQAMLIEAFIEVTGDLAAVEQMKMWLLKQKQTQDWKTSRATADAIYALILRGTDLLASDQLVEVTLGQERIDPLNMDGVEVEAGTGYFQVSRYGKEIIPEMAEVTVVKKDEGIAWGAVYWQYYEHLDKITPAKTPLSLEKELYIEHNTPSGPVLEPVSATSTLKTGDKLKVRIIIRTDRDMEYVHMKDMRAAAFEPVSAISGYRWQGGLGYYESIRDASVNFYFEYLRKGTYVFEYLLNVTQKGEFSNGITSIQCLYAPEFAAHSQGTRVKVE
jgi:hypothetical protein